MADLIPTAALLAAADILAGIYDRKWTVDGDGSEAYSAVLNGSITATAMSLVLGDWTDPDLGIPPVGTLTINSERIRYRTQSGTTITVEARGADNTAAAAHLDGATVYLPSSVAALAKRATQQLIGDGDAIPGLGEPYKDTIADLLRPFVEEELSLKNLEQLRLLVTQYYSSLDGHIAKEAGQVLTQPADTSFGPLTVSDLNTLLRYRNDRDTGSAYSCLLPWQAAFEYWLYTGGSILDNKVVFPPRTTLQSGTEAAGGAVTFTTPAPDPINRYGVEDPETWTQGYAGQRMQARVTAADTGSAAITLTGQGMDGEGRYFGRGKIVYIHPQTTTTGKTVEIGGVVYTACAGTANPDETIATTVTTGATGTTQLIGDTTGMQVGERLSFGGTVRIVSSVTDATHVVLTASLTTTTGMAVVPVPNQFAIGATNAATCVNLKDRIVANGTDTILAEINNDDPTLASKVILTIVSETATTNYEVISSDASVLGLEAGSSPTDVVKVTFGGGGDDGTGADSDVTDDPETDDARTWTGTLNMAAVGNVATLAPGTAGDRLLQIVTISATGDGGAAGTGRFVVESIPDRVIH